MFLYLFFTLYLEIDFHTKNTLFCLQYDLLFIQYNKLKITKNITERETEREADREGKIKSRQNNY